MTDQITLTILDEMSAAQLVHFHNSIPEVRQVSRFSDGTTGRKRLEIALERAGLKLARGPEGYRIVAVEAATAVQGEAALLKRIVSVAPNPKRLGTASHARFALYKNGMTMREYIEAAMRTGISRQKARKDIYWDRDHGFISVKE